MNYRDTIIVTGVVALSISFSQPEIQKVVSEPVKQAAQQVSKSPALQAVRPSVEVLFPKHEESSIRAIAPIVVCAAEGNCNSDGSYTENIKGHDDPAPQLSGGYVRNIGFCSYNGARHGKDQPQTLEEGNAECNKLLKQRTAAYFNQLDEMGVTPDMLPLEAILNGIDVATQAPAALFGKGGFTEHYLEAKKDPEKVNLLFKEVGALKPWLQEKLDSITDPVEKEELKMTIYGRSMAYINPSTGALNAPGLGNTMPNVVHDVTRRVLQIDAAVQKNQELVAKVVETKPPDNGNGEGNVSMKYDQGAIIELLKRVN
jgi:hypothetical protein